MFFPSKQYVFLERSSIMVVWLHVMKTSVIIVGLVLTKYYLIMFSNFYSEIYFSPHFNIFWNIRFG